MSNFRKNVEPAVDKQDENASFEELDLPSTSKMSDLPQLDTIKQTCQVKVQIQRA